MTHSESISNIAAALAVFQGKCPTVDLDRTVSVRTKTGGTYQFRYATLGNIRRVIAPVLAECKLSFVQTIGEGGAVTTMLMHESGEWIADTFRITSGSGSPQDIGSAITYAKRYALSSMLGIVADDDNDANIAEGNQFQVTATGSNPTSKANQNGKPITAAQLQKGKNDILRSMAASGLNASDLEKDLLMQAEGTDYTHLAQDAKDYLSKIVKEERKKNKDAAS